MVHCGSNLHHRGYSFKDVWFSLILFMAVLTEPNRQMRLQMWYHSIATTNTGKTTQILVYN